MNKENTKRRVEAFPDLYRMVGIPTAARREEYERSHNPGVYNMQWGVECGNGWFELIYNLSGQIMQVSQQYGLRPAAAQVKEKFGTLRFYGHFQGEMSDEARSKIRALTEEAGEQSADTCEFCGVQGVMRKGGWWHVACDPCERQYRAGEFRGMNDA